MKGNINSLLNLVVLTALVLALAGVAIGCGGGASESYQTAVLQGWEKLQKTSRELGAAANEIEDSNDLEDFSGELAAARLEIASFEGELSDLKVAAAFVASHEALEKFLSDYDEYLEAMQDMLDLFLAGGDLSTYPTIAPLEEQVLQSLRDYQVSQEYNPAQLDREVWDVLHILDETIGSAVVVNASQGALEVVDTWYSLFNVGDGGSMYILLDPQSPVRSSYSREFFLAQVGEAYQGDLRASYQITDSKLNTDARGNWCTVYLTVSYSGTVDMEGNPVPPSSEDIQFMLVDRGTGWLVYNIDNGSRIY